MNNNQMTKISVARREFLASAAAVGLGITASAAAQDDKPSILESSTSSILEAGEKKPVVGAYYYPWYDAPDNAGDIGWMRKAMRGRLDPKQLPRQGVYSSRDAETIADHIAQCVRGGIDFLSVSWWGPHHTTNTALKNHILPHPDAGKLKYALLYESTGRFGSFNRPSYSRFVSDFEYMRENYFSNPHYLRIDDKPVVFIYLTRVYFRRQDGRDALRRLREAFPDVYLIGDDVFGPDYSPEYAELWDAITAYDGYGQSLPRGGATRAGLEELLANYVNAKEIADSVGTGFIPGVSPGYNDKAVRSGHPGRARYFKDVPDSEEGDLFRAMLREVALPNVDSRTGNVMMVNSFNEWYEDTQIEATVGTASPTAKDDSESGSFYTEGETYADYGYLYLDILREMTKSM